MTVLLFRWYTIQEVVVLYFKVKTFPSWFKEVSPLILCSPSVLVNPTTTTTTTDAIYKPPKPSLEVKCQRRHWHKESYLIWIRKLLDSAIMISIFARTAYFFSFWTISHKLDTLCILGLKGRSLWRDVKNVKWKRLQQIWTILDRKWEKCHLSELVIFQK